MTKNNMDENYRFFIENEWKDIHHSRIQEWSALGLIAAIHIGLVQLLKLLNETNSYEIQIDFLIPICCFIALIFSSFGVLMVCRHRRLMWIKLNWIFEAEEKLGLIKNSDNPNGIIPEDYRMKKYSKVDYEMQINKEKVSNSKKTIWNKLMWPRRLSTSWLMVMLYIIFGIIDFGIGIYSIVYIVIK
jgi:hypothetical protein